MAENESGQDKTEAATPRKRQQAREKGNVPKSQEINTTLILIAGVVAFFFFAERFYGKIALAIQIYLGQCHIREVNPESAHAIILELGFRVLEILMPFFIIFVVVALAINFAQVGLLFSAQALRPKFERLNPISGFKRLFSIRGRIELVKAIAKMMVIAPVMIYTVYYALPGMRDLMGYEAKQILIHIGWKALEVAVYALLVMLILSLLDFVYQRWQFEQDLKMTKQEVKQEMKDIQGDPQIKGRIRSLQMEMARRRMMQEVPEAEVVVTNPTEYAIALKYGPNTGLAAPMVVAKGRGALARRIKEIALEHDVPIVENRPLAQSLYKLVEVGDLIPPDLYQAVAEVLAYVYRLKERAHQWA